MTDQTVFHRYIFIILIFFIIDKCIHLSIIISSILLDPDGSDWSSMALCCDLQSDQHTVFKETDILLLFVQMGSPEIYYFVIITIKCFPIIISFDWTFFIQYFQHVEVWCSFKFLNLWPGTQHEVIWSAESSLFNNKQNVFFVMKRLRVCLEKSEKPWCIRGLHGSQIVDFRSILILIKQRELL